MYFKMHVSIFPGRDHVQYPMRRAQVWNRQRRVSCREREQQKQAKQGSADASKQQQEAAAQPAQTPADPSSGSALVEDQLLPKSGMLPPAADPVGKGLLSAQELSGTCRSYTLFQLLSLYVCLHLRPWGQLYGTLSQLHLEGNLSCSCQSLLCDLRYSLRLLRSRQNSVRTLTSN